MARREARKAEADSSVERADLKLKNDSSFSVPCQAQSPEIPFVVQARGSESRKAPVTGHQFVSVIQELLRKRKLSSFKGPRPASSLF